MVALVWNILAVVGLVTVLLSVLLPILAVLATRGLRRDEERDAEVGHGSSHDYRVGGVSVRVPARVDEPARDRGPVGLSGVLPLRAHHARLADRAAKGFRRDPVIGVDQHRSVYRRRLAEIQARQEAELRHRAELQMDTDTGIDLITGKRGTES
jgi:hypothetical protein